MPPEGEFILMNYRINEEFAPPFKIYTIIEESDYKLVLRVKLQANFNSNNKAGNIVISFHAPNAAQSIYFHLPKELKDIHRTDYDPNTKKCVWKVPKIVGGAEHTLDVNFTLQTNTPSLSRKEIGPIVMSFEIPNYNVSHLQIKELNVLSNDSKYNAQKWVRILTMAKSYVTRIG